MLCPKCGNEVESGQRFCQKCGNQMEMPTFQTAVNAVPQQVKAKKNNIAMYIILALVALLLVIVIVLIGILINSNSKTNNSGNSVITVQPQTDSKNEPDFNGILQKASELADLGTIVDYNDSVEIPSSDYSLTAYRITIPNVKTKDEFYQYACNYYTEDVVKKIVGDLSFYENENGLYVALGDGGSTILKYYITIDKVSDNQYKLNLFEFYMESYYLESVNLNYSNGKWLVDDVFSFDFYGNYEIIEKDDKRYELLPVLGAYVSQIESHFGAEYSELFYYNVFLYDFDSDGMLDLVCEKGTCEADRLATVYTYKNNTVSKMGEFSTWHSDIYGRDGKMYTVCGHDGIFDVSEIYYDGSKVTSKLVMSSASDAEISSVDYYQYPRYTAWELDGFINEFLTTYD